MILNAVEQKAMRELGKTEPFVQRMLEELLNYDEDPAKIFYLEMTMMMKAIAGEMAVIREGDKEALKNIKILKDKDTFGMIKDLFTNSEKIFTGLHKGKMQIDPNAKEKEKGDDDQVILKGKT